MHGVPFGWDPTDYLLADLFHALTGEEHPARPKSSADSADPKEDLVAKLRAQRERLAAQSTPS